MRKLLLLVVLMSTWTLSAQKDEDSDESSFHKIEKVPVFPGCKGNNKRLKKCFQKKMVKHLSKKFNTEITNEIDLPSGKTQIILTFKINENGVPTDFMVKAAHESLKQEAIRVMELLPNFKPGTLEGKPVSVKYSIPMYITVEGSNKKDNE